MPLLTWTMPANLKNMREVVLSRMLYLLSTVPGIVQVFRDRASIPEEDADTGEPNLPAAILLDGKEVTSMPLRGRTGLGVVAASMVLSPQIFIILMPRPNLTNEGVGEELSGFLVAVQKVILQDQLLINLLGPNGQIEYRGHDTDLQTGSTFEGQMQIDFALTYTFDPSVL